MLYFLSLLLVTLACGIVGEEDTRLKLKPGQRYSINNVNFPGNYPPGRIGSWDLKADLPVTLQCLIFNVPESPGCKLERFIINDGPHEKILCSNKTFTYISETNEVRFGYHSSAEAKGGYFYCEFVANKKNCTRHEYVMDVSNGTEFCIKPN